MDKRRIEHLDHLLEFIQKDFDKVSDVNEQFSLMEIGRRLLTRQYYLVNDPDQHPEFSSWEELVEKAQGLKVLLDLIFVTTLKNGFLFYDRPVILPCLKPFSEYRQNFAPKMDEGKYKVSAFYSNKDIQEGDLHSPDIYEVEEPLEVYIDVTGFVVMDALQELPFDRLKICPTCRKYFLQKTARVKKFCSDYCKNKHNLKQKELLK